MPLPVGLEDREPVRGHDAAETSGRHLEDSPRVVLRLELTRSLDEEAREAPVVEGGDPGGLDEIESDRRQQRVTALLKDPDLAPLEPGDRDHLVGGIGDLGVDDERASEMRAHAVLNPELGNRTRGCLAVDAASDDAPAEARDEDNCRGEVRLAHLIVDQAPRDCRVEKNEVGSKVGDQTAIERGRHHPVDGEQVAAVSKLTQTRDRDVIELAVSLAVHDPGDLGGVHPEVAAFAGDHELRSREHRSRQRHQEHCRSGVLRESERIPDHRLRRSVGRAWQRLVPEIDAVDQVDHRLQRDSSSRRIGGAGRGRITHR
jgi:hypothetical protein